MGKPTIPASMANYVNQDGMLLNPDEVEKVIAEFAAKPELDKIKFTKPRGFGGLTVTYPIFKVFDEKGAPRYVVKFKPSWRTSPLGDGGTSNVWHAQDLQTGQVYALKLTTMNAMRGYTEKYLQMAFVREVGLWKRLNENPELDLITIHQRNKVTKHFITKFLAVIPLIEGKDFQTWSDANFGKINPALHLRLCINLVKQVISLYNHGILHRDVKLENAMIDPSTHELKLIDFGSAYDISGLPEGSEFVDVYPYGTPGLVAPEVSSRRYSIKSDVYSLGATIAWLSGLKVDGDSLNDTGNPFAPFKKIPAHVSTLFLEIIKMAVDPNPAQRPMPTQLLSMLESLAEKLTSAPQSASSADAQPSQDSPTVGFN